MDVEETEEGQEPPKVRIGRGEDGPGIRRNRVSQYSLKFIYRGEFHVYWAPVPKMRPTARTALANWGLVEYRQIGDIRLARLTPAGRKVRDDHHRRRARRKP